MSHLPIATIHREHAKSVMLASSSHLPETKREGNQLTCFAKEFTSLQPVIDSVNGVITQDWNIVVSGSTPASRLWPVSGLRIGEKLDEPVSGGCCTLKMDMSVGTGVPRPHWTQEVGTDRRKARFYRTLAGGVPRIQ